MNCEVESQITWIKEQDILPEKTSQADLREYLMETLQLVRQRNGMLPTISANLVNLSHVSKSFDLAKLRSFSPDMRDRTYYRHSSPHQLAKEIFGQDFEDPKGQLACTYHASLQRPKRHHNDPYQEEWVVVTDAYGGVTAQGEFVGVVMRSHHDRAEGNSNSFWTQRLRAAGMLNTQKATPVKYDPLAGMAVWYNANRHRRVVRGAIVLKPNSSTMRRASASVPPKLHRNTPSIASKTIDEDQIEVEDIPPSLWTCLEIPPYRLGHQGASPVMPGCPALERPGPRTCLLLGKAKEMGYRPDLEQAIFHGTSPGLANQQDLGYKGLNRVIQIAVEGGGLISPLIEAPWTTVCDYVDSVDEPIEETDGHRPKLGRNRNGVWVWSTKYRAGQGAVGGD